MIDKDDSSEMIAAIPDSEAGKNVYIVETAEDIAERIPETCYMTEFCVAKTIPPGTYAATRYTAYTLWTKFQEYVNKGEEEEEEIIDRNGKKKTIPSPMFLEDFCVFANIHISTFENYAKKNEEFLKVYQMIGMICSARLIKNALLFKYHAELTKFILQCKHGYQIVTKIESNNVNENVDLNEMAYQLEKNVEFRQAAKSALKSIDSKLRKSS